MFSNLWKFKLSVFVLLMVSMSHVYSASSCSQVFPGGANVTSPSGKITFNKCAYVQDNPSKVLVTPSFTQNSSGCSPPSCYTADCIASGTTAATLILPTFPTISGSNVTVNSGKSATIGGNGNQTTSYGTVTLSGNSTLNFSANASGNTLYKIKTLTTNKSGNVINFQPGDYWIQNFNCRGDNTFNVVGTGTARLYFQSLTTSGTQNWNNVASPVNSNPTPNQLLIISYGNITFNDSADINGLIYANGLLTVQKSETTIKGAVTAQSITLNSSPTIQYSPSAVSGLPFGSLCNGGSSSVSQFDVSAPSTATNCQDVIVTVTAQDSSSETVASYNGAITISTQTGSGTWVSTTGKGTFSGGSSGVATYQFVSSDNGVVSFQLSYPGNGTSPVTIKASQTNNASISGLSGSIAFNPSQFIIVESTTAVGSPPAPAGYSTAQVAGSNFTPTVKLVAYASCGAGVATSYSGNKSIKLYSTYVNPTPANAAGTAVMVNGTAIAKNSTATATSQTLNFVSGVATLTTVKYSDVGSLTLTALDNSIPTMTGTSGNIVVKPYNFVISGSNIPGTNSPAGTVFAKAGQPFSATVTVQGSDGSTAKSYGKESPAAGIFLQSASLAAPAGGRNGSDNLGTIGNASVFTNTSPGVFTGTTFTFDEVGSINLLGRVLGGSYLGAGDVVGSSVLVGRFQPNHFAVTGNTPQFSTGCGAGQFTYLDQPFVYGTAPAITVIAKAANNPISTNYTTQNYNGSFKKISPSQFPAASQNYQSGTGGLAIDTSVASLPLPTETNSGTGTMTYTFAASGGGANQGLRLNRPLATATPSSPVTANITLQLTVADTDTPAVTYASNPFIFNGSGSGIAFNLGASFRHGRLSVSNAYGSEIANLTVPMNVQYYNGSQFVNNTVDSCTSLSNTANIILTDPPAPQTAITTTASLPQPNFVNGASYIQLSAPNASGQKFLQVNLGSAAANLPWLQYNWPFSPGTYQNPQAQANFGVYKGNPNVIYQRENYP